MIVSLIIPSYNHKDYVVHAINSALKQTWPTTDIIVIDDGSTDGSAKIISQLHRDKGGFRFVSHENRGLIATLNEGLDLAKGEYFCELASDDYLSKNSIEKRINFLQKDEELVAVFADAIGVKYDHVTNDKLIDNKRRQVFKKKDPIPDLLEGHVPIFSTGMFKKDKFQNLGGFDPRYHYYEDLEMSILLPSAGKIGFLDEPVLFRRIHESNVSNNKSYIRHEKVLCYKKLLNHPNMKPYRSLIRYRLQRSYLALGRYLSKTKGGTSDQRRIFNDARAYIWRDLRLMWHFLRWREK